jgi:hypothetical protein
VHACPPSARTSPAKFRSDPDCVLAGERSSYVAVAIIKLAKRVQESKQQLTRRWRQVLRAVLAEQHERDGGLLKFQELRK